MMSLLYTLGILTPLVCLNCETPKPEVVTQTTSCPGITMELYNRQQAELNLQEENDEELHSRPMEN
jgi:hypothetical protein